MCKVKVYILKISKLVMEQLLDVKALRHDDWWDIGCEGMMIGGI
jgi:hypothetical protein